MIQYGWLDDFGAVTCWRDYPPSNGQGFITRRVIRQRAVKPTVEQYGEARW